MIIFLSFICAVAHTEINKDKIPIIGFIFFGAKIIWQECIRIGFFSFIWVLLRLF